MFGLMEIGKILGGVAADLMKEAMLRRENPGHADVAEKAVIEGLVALAKTAIQAAPQIPFFLKPLLLNDAMLTSMAKSLDDAAEGLIATALKVVGR